MLNQKGFTLIELVVVIVILGILSAVAVPKFIDLQTEAKDSAANGVYGAANSAAALNHAKKLVKGDVPADYIDNGTTLVAAMDGTPDGWVVDDTGAAGAVGLAFGTVGDVGAAEYSIIVNTFETATGKAQITKGGTAAPW